MEVDWLESFPREKPTVIPKDYRGLGVLLVDHNTSSLMQIRSILEGYHYKVTTNELADVALSILQERTDQYGVVMADINMPQMNIFTFLRHIRAIKDMPVIHVDMVWLSQREGAIHMLEKPIPPEQLKNVWQHVYGKRRSLRVEAENEEKEKIEEEEIISRTAIAKDILEINNEHAKADMKGKGNEIDEGNNQVEENPANYLDDVPGGRKRKGKGDDCDDKRGEGGDSKESNEWQGKKMKGKFNSPARKNPRMAWTPDLHLQFTEAITILGTKEARPKKILEIMNVPNLTQRQVASHLQKYRDRMQRNGDTERINQLSPRSKMAKSTLNFYVGNVSRQRQTSLGEFPKGPQIPNSKIGATTTMLTPLHAPFNPQLSIDVSSDLAENPHSYDIDKQNNGVQACDHCGFHILTRARNVSASLKDPNSSINKKGKQLLEVEGSTENDEYRYKSTNVSNSDQFFVTFSGLNREMDLARTRVSYRSSLNPSGSAIQNQPSLKYVELVKVLEDGIEDFNSQPTVSEIEKYCEWLEIPQEQLDFEK